MSRASRRSATPNACPRTTRQRSWEERCRKSTSGSASPQSDGIAQEPATALLIVDLDKHIGNARAWRDTFGPFLQQTDIALCLLPVLTFALLCTSGLTEHSIHKCQAGRPARLEWRRQKMSLSQRTPRSIEIVPLT